MEHRRSIVHSLLGYLKVWSVFVLLVSSSVAETIKISGHGQVPLVVVKHQKEQAAINQTSLANAQELARRDAIRQAILQVSVDRNAVSSQLELIAQSVLDHSASLIVDQEVTDASIRGDSASVDLIMRLDAKSLRSYLEDNFGISANSQMDGKFKIFVMSYTVEGMDPNRARPQVLHEEVVNDQKGVNASSFANSESDSASQSSSASVTANRSSSDKGQFSNSANVSGQYQSNANMALRTQEGSASASEYQSGKVNASESSSANWDKNKSANLKASQQESASASYDSASSGSAYSDTSHYYRRVVDYADPTKRGAGASDEVRIELEGMLNTAGFEISTLNVSMMNREFPGEDDIANAVLDEMRKNPAVGQDDYVAIALNSFTPVNTVSHRFTSKVTYRIVRVKDGRALLPAADLPGDSGNSSPSDDVARTYAVKSALRKVEDFLPGQIKQALHRAQQSDVRDAAIAATYYSIVVESPSSFTTSAPIRTALKSAGFSFERSTFRAGQAETLTVSLNGKAGQDVMEAIEGALGAFDVLSMDKQNAHVKAK